MGDVIERRWRNQFFRPLGPDDDKVVESARRAVGDFVEFYLRNVFEQLLEGARIRAGTLNYRPRDMAMLRYVMNSWGLEISGGDRPHGNHYLRLLGHTNEGAPKAACLLGPWAEDERMLSGSLFIEALPLEATVELVRDALQVLPDIPKAQHRSPLPQHDKMLTGRYAEWVLNAEDVLATLGLVDYQPSV